MKRLIYLNLIVLFVISIFIAKDENLSEKKYNFLKESEAVSILAPKGLTNDDVVKNIIKISDKNNVFITIEYMLGEEMELVSNSNEALNTLNALEFDINNMKNINPNRRYYIEGNTEDIKNFYKELSGENYLLTFGGYKTEMLFYKTDIFLISYFFINAFIIYFSYILDTRKNSIYIMEGYSKSTVYIKEIKPYVVIILLIYIISFVVLRKNFEYLILCLGLLTYILLIYSKLYSINILKGIKNMYYSRTSLVVTIIFKFVMRIIIIVSIYLIIMLITSLYEENKMSFELSKLDDYTKFEQGVRPNNTDFNKEQSYADSISKMFYIETVENNNGILIQDYFAHKPYSNYVVINDNYLDVYNSNNKNKIENLDKKCDLFLVPKEYSDDFSVERFIETEINFLDPEIYGKYEYECIPKVVYYDKDIILNTYQINAKNENFKNKVIIVDNTRTLPKYNYGFAISKGNYMIDKNPNDYSTIKNYDPVYIRNIIYKSSDIDSEISSMFKTFENYILIFIILCVIYGVLLLNIIYVYFKINQKKYLIKFIEGINRIKIHSKYIVFLMTENIFILILSATISWKLFVIILISALIEFLLNMMYIIILYKKQTIKLLKGDECD